MNFPRLIFYLFLLFLFPYLKGNNCYAQLSQIELHKIDSLNAIINNKLSHDTSVAASYYVLSEMYFITNTDTLIPLCKKAQKLIEKTLPTTTSIKVKNKLLNTLADALNNIGYVYNDKGDIAKALDYYYKSLEILEKLDNKIGVARAYNNLGIVFYEQKDVEKAIEYYKKSLNLLENTNELYGKGYILDNIASIYDDQKKISEALEYYRKSFAAFKAAKSEQGMAAVLNNIGVIYFNKSNNLPKTKINSDSIKSNAVKALSYFNRSLELKEKINDKDGITYSLTTISQTLIILNQKIKAEKLALQNLKLSKELGYPATINNAAKVLNQIYRQQKNYKKALEMYELHIQMRDSINNSKTQKATIRQQTKYEFEKAQLIKEQEEKEALRLQNEKTKRRNNLQYSILFVAILAVFGLVLSLGFIKISPKFAEGLIFFAFLLFFEFLLVLFDPYIENWTGGEPMYKLLLNAILAAAIFPLHAFFENYLKLKLIKNKRR